MIGALIGITLVSVAAAYALRRLLSKPPIVVACAAAVVALTWATRSLGVCIASVIVSGVFVAAVEGFVRRHEETAP
jgi:hypothetical protein